MDIRLHGKQDGVALFISLVLLLVLTLLGVSAMQGTSMQERMSRNSHDSVLAFQAAESALRDAEAFVETLVTTAAFNDAGAGGLWTAPDFGDQPRWELAGVWADARSTFAPTAVADVRAQPRFFVEHVATVIREENAYQLDDDYIGSIADRVEVFRITARGQGGGASSQVVLQSTYGRILE